MGFIDISEYIDTFIDLDNLLADIDGEDIAEALSWKDSESHKLFIDTLSEEELEHLSMYILSKADSELLSKISNELNNRVSKKDGANNL